MAWTYWYWVWCNIFISTAIFLMTLVTMIILLCCFERAFFGIVARLFNIKYCTIDVHHNIIQKNRTINLSSASIPKAVSDRVLPFKGRRLRRVSNKESYSSSQSGESASVTSSPTTKIVAEPSENSPSHPEHERHVLNIYGKFLTLNKVINKISVTILTTVVISAALMAFFDNLFLTTTTVYRGGTCPSYGSMECFCGNNNTYFQCDDGETISCSEDALSATCFRWTARDITTSQVTTQIGVTAGLLTALGSIAECVIRLYLLAFNKRLGVAHGIDCLIAKTVGMNRITAPSHCYCCDLCCHWSVFSLSKYKHPYIAVILTFVYISIPFLVVPGITLLYYYELNVTALTFIILITTASLCVLTLVWIVIQDDESSANISGGWSEAKRIIHLADEAIQPLDSILEGEN